MKPPLLLLALMAACVFIIGAACNLTSPVSPSTPPPANQVATTAPTPAPSPTVPPPPPPTPVKSPLHWGTYRSPIDTNISDQFLEDFKVIGGVPPLEWANGWVSVVVDQAGTVTSGGAFFWIFTNPKGGDVCTSGEYQFSVDSATGTYNIADNTLTVEMTGEERYGPLGGGSRCADSFLVGQTTREFIFAVKDDRTLVLCKPGETGVACLANPMAILDQ